MENHSEKASLWAKAKGFILPKLKFASTSVIATSLDYFLYLILVAYFFSPVISNIISSSCGMLTNFILQKRFVFRLERKTSTAFILSIGFSVLGVGLSTLLIYSLNHIDLLRAHQYITKLIVTGIIFFYNFYTKRFAFENK